MALVAFGWEVKIELVDAGNERTTKTYQLNSTAGTDYTSAAAAAVTIRTALEAVTDLNVASVRLSQVFLEDALTLPATAEKEDQAIVAFQILNQPNKEGTFTIPGASIGIFVGASGASRNIVDVADTALDTYSDLFTTGGVALISDGEQLDYMIRGNRRHVYNNKG